MLKNTDYCFSSNKNILINSVKRLVILKMLHNMMSLTGTWETFTLVGTRVLIPVTMVLEYQFFQWC